VEQCRGVIPRRVGVVVQTGGVRSLNAPAGGAGIGLRPPPPIETETRSTGRSAPKRGGVPLEEVSDPQERRNLTQGGTDPRARRICSRAAPYPSSGAEFRPRVAGLIVLTGRGSMGLFRTCV
jgi:hypothetical protein